MGKLSEDTRIPQNPELTASFSQAKNGIYIISELETVK